MSRNLNQKTDELIRNLASELKPIKVLKFGFTDFVKVMSVGILCIAAAIFILGIRFDISSQIINLRFMIETLILFVLGVTSIFSAYKLSIPGPHHISAFKIPAALFALYLIVFVVTSATNTDPFAFTGYGFTCISEILGISLFPSALLFYMIRRAAAVNRDILGLVAILAGLAFGLIGVQLTCIDDTPLHIALWHILPALVVMILGIFISRVLIKKI